MNGGAVIEAMSPLNEANDYSQASVDTSCSNNDRYTFKKEDQLPLAEAGTAEPSFGIATGVSLEVLKRK